MSVNANSVFPAMCGTLLTLLLFLTPAPGCQVDVDCSLNGKCIGGSCECEAAWKGSACDELNLLPADLRVGYDSPYASAGGRTSSWGGSVLYDNKTNLYHMYAAEMENYCGIQAWEPNSRVVHSTSPTPVGPYTFRDVVVQPFAHEPNAVRGPNGEFVIYMTMRHPDGFVLENCTEPVPRPPPSPPKPPGPPPPCYKPPHRSTYMTWSTSPYGPWTEPVLVLQANYSKWGNCPALIDTNLAMAIKKDGSAIGIWRKCVNTEEPGRCQVNCCTFPRMATASNWKDPSTYDPHSDRVIFPDLKPYGAEDPFVWLDEEVEGAVHAVLHDEQGETRSSANGTHAFSPDNGVTWYYGANLAYGSAVHTIDGETVPLARRERPHLVLDTAGFPIALTNGVQMANASTDCHTDAQCFRSFTLAQPLQREEMRMDKEA